MFSMWKGLDNLLFSYIFQPLTDWMQWHPTQAANRCLVGSSVLSLTGGVTALINPRQEYPLAFIIALGVSALIVNPILYWQNSALGHDLNQPAVGNLKRGRQVISRVLLVLLFLTLVVFTSNFVFTPIGMFVSIGFLLFIAQLYFVACDIARGRR